MDFKVVVAWEMGNGFIDAVVVENVGWYLVERSWSPYGLRCWTVSIAAPELPHGTPYLLELLLLRYCQPAPHSVYPLPPLFLLLLFSQ